jgi:outer membrane receptor protein involved in Fe transport
MFEFADVQRVEVLKGPQGTLYGRNATGGAIRVITKDVADELEGSVKASVGNFSYYGLSGTVSVPITSRRWALRNWTSRASPRSFSWSPTAARAGIGFWEPIASAVTRTTT